MKRTVLLVTASLELGQLISKSLSETYQFDVHHCRDEQSAVAFLQAHTDCGYALIETALGERRVIILGQVLRRIRSTIKLVLISRILPSADVDQIRPWILLRQPFVLPELLSALDAVSPTIIEGNTVEIPASIHLSWLDDPNVAIKTLQHLADAPNIEEILLLRDSNIWASAGNLNLVTLNKIKNVVLSNLHSEQEFDLLRFMRLGDQDNEHGLWAKLIMVNVILAVIYDLTTSFSEMRQQTNMLADALALPLLSPVPERSELSLSARILAKRLRGRRSTLLLASALPDRSQSDFYKSSQTKNNIVDPYRLQPPRLAAGDLSSNGSDTFGMVDREVGNSRIDHKESKADDSSSVSPSTGTRDSKRNSSRSVDEAQRQLEPEADSLDSRGIPFSCLLTPRFETHRLEGELAEVILSTLSKVCIAYGWALEFMEVTQDCLQWVARLQPTETVADHIHKIRHLTSERIWEVCPEFLRENFSKDFWAPGYSILAGVQRHSRQQIQAYVLKYRGPHYRFKGGSSLQSDPSADTRLD